MATTSSRAAREKTRPRRNFAGAAPAGVVYAEVVAEDAVVAEGPGLSGKAP
jgi:hypothetical protein